MQVVISFDSTGSMYSCLTEVRTKVIELMRTLFTQVPNLEIGLIAHGDYGDYPYTLKQQTFTNDQKKLEYFVKTAEQTNGFGNGGECYELVMNHITELNWTHEKRVAILIGDEPPHVKGRTKNGILVKHDWRIEATHMYNLGILGYVVRCQNRQDSAIYHSDLAKIFGTNLLTLQQFTNIVPLLTATILYQEHTDLFEGYQTELESAGLFNNNLRSIFNSVARRVSTAVPTTNGLNAVDPYRFQLLTVPMNCDIMSFVKGNGARFQKGKGFYELTKREEVQERKEIVLMDAQGNMFSGVHARDMIGLPYGQRGNVYPQNIGYTVFVQSTSSNRKLIGGTRFLYEAEMY